MENLNDEHKNKTVFFIGKIKHETDKAALTVKEILTEYAKVNPEEKSLTLKQGNEPHEYTNNDEMIEMKDGMHFVLFDKTPTTASWITE